jgi:hypothetical protein
MARRVVTQSILGWRRFLIAGGAALLGACSMDIPLMSFKRDASPSAPQVTAEALVGADGACATPAQPPRGIALGMTECDLVAVAGPTERIEIGADERGQRTAVLTYPSGDRAGIYRFTAGQLTVIDRLPEEPRKEAPRRGRTR